MGIDRPDGADVPSDDPSDRPTSADRSAVQRETRTRQEYYDDLRAAISEEIRTGKRTPPDPSSPPDPKPNGKPWHEVTAWSTRVWLQYQHKWPPDERPPIDRSADPPGSWRGDGNQFLDRPANEEIDEECDHIAQHERERISPALLEIESRDPDRQLVGFEHRRKGRDRIKEKVAEAIEQYVRSPKDAISDVPDAVRYTFQYTESHYTQGVQDDLARLEDQGFQKVELRNSWTGDQYKGINSRWIDSVSGQRLEVQFHTRISFDAKQITHAAYERLRSGQTDELERMVLKAFQREVSAEIPIPPGATDIPDYSEGARDAR